MLVLALCSSLLLSGCGGDTVESPEDPGELREDGTRVYAVPNAYFTFEKYEILSKGPTDIGDNFSVFSSHVVEIHARCAAALEEITAIIKLYDSNGRVVGNYRATKKDCDLGVNENFVLSADISNDAKEQFSVIEVKFEGKSPSRLLIAGEINYNVTFVYNNGNPPKMLLVRLGGAVPKPETIPEKDGYIFEGWFADPACTEPYDFENSDVDKDINLYAGYMLDYIRMGEKLVDMAKLTTVTVNTKSYSSLLWGAYEMASSEKSGEGIIMKDDSGKYYVLSTYDLVKKEDGFEKTEYKIKDYYGNVYNASVIHSSENYNLCILEFEKTHALLVSRVAQENPQVGDEIAIARYFEESGYHPCFGKVLSYEKVVHGDIDTSAHDIGFNMMIHNADTDVRVSGRPMFNMNMELVGIQCGTLTESEIELASNHVIPLEVIRKYIKNYGP